MRNVRHKRKLVRSLGRVRVVSQAELRRLIDVNARKFLGLNAGKFLRLRKQGKPVESPAWGPIDMMASLLD